MTVLFGQLIEVTFQLIVVVGTDTLKRREFFQYFRAPPATPAGVRRLPEEIEAEMKSVERGLGKLSYITITYRSQMIVSILIILRMLRKLTFLNNFQFF